MDWLEHNLDAYRIIAEILETRGTSATAEQIHGPSGTSSAFRQPAPQLVERKAGEGDRLVRASTRRS
jgi:hypothetical protein